MTKKKQLPGTVKEAVAHLVEKMSEKDKEALRNMTQDSLIDFHFGWGMGIRNSLGLWGGNTQLLEDTGAMDADDASVIIIKAVWKEVRKKR